MRITLIVPKSFLCKVLFVENLRLVHFRNYIQRSFQFTERIICVCGANGTGKTNLLDAIHYLSITKSYFSRTDIQSVAQGRQGMRIEGTFELKNRHNQLVYILRENNKKEFLVNGESYKRLSEHLGKFPCVMIAPDDVELISGGSEGRRTFIDTIICQFDHEYLQKLISYNKILVQRNSLLKSAAENSMAPDKDLLLVLNEQLSTTGQSLYIKRQLFMKDYIPMVLHHYQKIAEQDDGLDLTYESQLKTASFKELLDASYQKDLLLQRTNVGIHKDELDIVLQSSPFKSMASQGQRKSLLFALKLAEWDTLKLKNGFSPILLLDDVFEKLDEFRMNNLLHWVCIQNEGQVFITDTHKERLGRQLKDIKANFQIITLS